MMLASIVLPRPTSSASMARPPMSRSTRWATSIWWGSSLIALASRVISRSKPGTRAMRSASRRSSYQARSAGGSLSLAANAVRARSSTTQESSGSGWGSGSVTRCLERGVAIQGIRVGSCQAHLVRTKPLAGSAATFYSLRGEMCPPTRYIIQVDRPGERVDMATIRSLLEGAGVALDPNYGPLPINPQLGRYVVQGVASPDARERAEQIPGVRFFADAIQEPTS